MSRRIIGGTCLMAVSLLVWADGAHAQPGYITGVVRDVNGDAIAEARIVGENSQWQRRVEGTTNNDGRFSFVGLQPGRWLFIINRRGFESVQGFANVLGSGRGGAVTFVMERDPLHPPAPAGGVLANQRADELQDALDAADALFQRGEYDDAIDAYRAVLSSVPALTSVNLQIGHAYRAKNEPDRALAAYRAIDLDSPHGVEAQAAIDAVQSPGGRR